MKGLLKFFEIILTIIYVIWELAEILLLPAIFVAAGLMYDLPWQYYLATVGGYFIICIIVQIILHFIFKRFDKKYESGLLRLFKKKTNTHDPD
ncbi:MAG: hypothetical protein E7516_08255 [Ruminococcaceae bacterium]|nr:hypothetical protein [Oscillospiraceae bacterium]